MAYTIAVSNEKGGVAKTTTTMSLGAALAEIGNKVLLIDLDPQANLTLAAGLETSEKSRMLTLSLHIQISRAQSNISLCAQTILESCVGQSIRQIPFLTNILC